MAESLSNVFRHYLTFERRNLNPEYHGRLTACRQWKNARTLLIRRIIALRRLVCRAASLATARPARAFPRLRRA
jgi:hypothetical protein